MQLPRPRHTPGEAIERALRLEHHGTYKLGATDADAHVNIFDCWGYIRWCYGIPGHRPGYNVGPWATVSDDVNANSAIEDALHARDLFVLVDEGDQAQPGDILAYPTIHLPGRPRPWIGHGAIVLDGTDVRHYGLLTIIECLGPDGRYPAIRRGTGIAFDAHTITWPKPEHRSRLLRVVA